MRRHPAASIRPRTTREAAATGVTTMTRVFSGIAKSIFAGFLIVAPVYLAVLLVLRGMQTVVKLVRPLALLLPDWFPAEKALSLLLVVVFLFVVGVVSRRPAGR